MDRGSPASRSSRRGDAANTVVLFSRDHGPSSAAKARCAATASLVRRRQDAGLRRRPPSPMVLRCPPPPRTPTHPYGALHRLAASCSPSRRDQPATFSRRVNVPPSCSENGTSPTTLLEWNRYTPAAVQRRWPTAVELVPPSPSSWISSKLRPVRSAKYTRPIPRLTTDHRGPSAAAQPSQPRLDIDPQEQKDRAAEQPTRAPEERFGLWSKR